MIPTLFLLQHLGGALTGWTSSIIRTTHAALPSIAGFPSVYRRLNTRKVAALTLVLLIVGGTQVCTFAAAFQRSLSREPVNRLSLDYRAPYYRMYLIAENSGRTLVFGGLHMRGIQMYMAMLPNVLLQDVRSLKEASFKALLNQTWNSIFLYDDWVTIAVPAMIGAYPEFYANILRTRQYPGYSVETLWIDGESYALKMIPTTASTAPQINSNSCGTCQLLNMENIRNTFIRHNKEPVHDPQVGLTSRPQAKSCVVHGRVAQAFTDLSHL